MEMLYKKLNLTMPEFRLTRILGVSLNEKDSNLKFNGLDKDGLPYSYLESCKLK